jgi:hypothetical protein
VGKFRLDPEPEPASAHLVVDRPPLPPAGGPRVLPERSQLR